jgi:hypothetical protein
VENKKKNSGEKIKVKGGGGANFRIYRLELTLPPPRREAGGLVKILATPAQERLRLHSIERLDSLEPHPTAAAAAEDDPATFEAGFQPSKAHAGGI